LLLRFLHTLQRLCRNKFAGARLLVVNQMKAGKHSLVQNSADENAIVACPIRDDVPLMLDSPISMTNSIAGASDFGGFDNPIEAGFQAI
jgi:hypothetical protein